MKHLEIYNFGPIREIIMDFTRVNVFIGSQSVGKSCILKIACHCAWTEKRLMVTRDVAFFKKDNYFFEQLLAFHKLQGYDTNQELRIVYRTSFLTFEYVHKDRSFNCMFFNQWKAYKRAKLSYIPAERNVIATIPNWMELSYEDTNTRSFMADWMESRKEFVKNGLPIHSLNAEYYYNELKNVDMVKFTDMKNGLSLSNASSGVQSLIPVMLYVHYLTHTVFQNTTLSVAKGRDNVLLMNRLYNAYLKKMDGCGISTREHDLKINKEFLSFLSEEDKKEFLTRYNNYTLYQHSSIFLEEPEENLFPKTQSDVVYNLLDEVFSQKDRENSLFMATHSPYVLYALNNAILLNLVRRKMSKEEIAGLECANVAFRPKDISVWQIKDGTTDNEKTNSSNRIQDEYGLVRKNYFDCVMNSVMTDFANMLSFLRYEKR